MGEKIGDIIIPIMQHPYSFQPSNIPSLPPAAIMAGLCDINLVMKKNLLKAKRK